jgi:hypothetical protein
MSTTVHIRDWHELRRNSLLGFATVELPSGMVIADVTIHVSHGKPWASPPSRPMMGRNGLALRDAAGKIRYQPVIEFRDRDTRTRWSDAVIEAMRRVHPEVLRDVG